MKAFVPPRYAMGKCSTCQENLFLKEEAAAHLMGRIREIEAVAYSNLAFGEIIQIFIYEEGGVSPHCNHTFIMKAVFDPNNKVHYLRETDA